jgi:hypothetical protein
MKQALMIAALSLYARLSAVDGGQSNPSPTPLPHAHAHNDYLHERPLLDAMDHGFCSVEADIYLVEGKLLVAHERDKVRVDRTLQSLYLNPLRDRVKQNGGRVHRGGPSLILLIDVKSEAESTYLVLREILKEYSDILSVFSATGVETKAITAIISGNRARQLMAGEKVRYAALDGRLGDLDQNESKDLIPLISDNWSLNFKWRGNGAIPNQEKEQLKRIVEKAHLQGRKVRFWATADAPIVWQELRSSGVDLINTDDLSGLQRFLTEANSQKSKE